jgi:isocitrate/isopropylmalate dehydrogenase
LRPSKSARRRTCAATPQVSNPSAIESLRRTKVFLKAPITTPQGGGFKSLNVTTRKMLGLYANIRPCVAYHPYVDTLHPKMDVVIVRENEEDTYAGIEHRQSQDIYQCLKLISRPGCERIVRYAFRVRGPQQPQKGHLLHQGQHHEAHRRPVPQGLR